MFKKGIKYSAIKKNTFESVLMRWMKLEPIIQSEVSQKAKHQYSILTHIYGIQKDGNNNLVCETAKETQMYRSFLIIHLWGFHRSSDGRESACNAGDSGLIPGRGRSPGEGNSNPLQYSCLENFKNKGVWRATVPGFATSLTQLSSLHLFTSLTEVSVTPAVSFSSPRLRRFGHRDHSDTSKRG